MPTGNRAITAIAAGVVIIALAIILIFALRATPPVPVDEASIVTPEPSDTKDLFNPIVFYEAATPPSVLSYADSEDWTVLTSPWDAWDNGFALATPKTIPWKTLKQPGDHTTFEADLDGEETTGPIFMAIVPSSEPNARDGYWGDVAYALALTGEACGGLPDANSTDWRLRWIEKCDTFTNAQGQLVIHLSGQWQGFRDNPAWINVYIMPSEREGVLAAVLSDERFMDEQALVYVAAQGGLDVQWVRNMVRTMAESFSFTE